MQPDAERDARPDATGGVEDLMALVLNWGVFLSAAVILLGFALLLAHPAGPGPTGLTSVDAIWSGLRSGNPNAIIMAGLLLLLATPIVRVAAAAAAFTVRRERWHVWISVGVLLILLVSIVTGTGH